MSVQPSPRNPDYRYQLIEGDVLSSPLYRKICQGIQNHTIDEVGTVFWISYQDYLCLHDCLMTINKKSIHPLTKEAFQVKLKEAVQTELKEDSYEDLSEEEELFPLKIRVGSLGTCVHNFPQLNDIDWLPRKTGCSLL